MKLLIDQDLSGSTAALLRDLGHDALSAREIGMNRSEDTQLIEFALAHGQVIATMDSDYHQIIATQARQAPSVILLRLPSPSARQASELIHKVCTGYHEQLALGCLLTCTRRSIRLRMLPISRNR